MNLRLREFSASHYRSLQRIRIPVADLDVFVGANGAGKTNLYRAMELMRAAAANTLGSDLAREGLADAFWAGERRRGPAQIKFSAVLSEQGAQSRRGTYTYEIAVGFPPKAPGAKTASGAFEAEPDIKDESLTFSSGQRITRLFERKGRRLMARDEAGRPTDVEIDLLGSETVLGRLEDPSRYPALDLVRRILLGWRFYHDLRTDAASAMRRSCIAVASPTLSSDGSNLAAVFATLAYIKEDTVDLDLAIDRAFPGARLVVAQEGNLASFGMIFPDFPGRTFSASELSDGTLRFLALAGALLGYRLPPFLAFNEPESSLHPDLLEPLADLLVQASRRAQVWLVTHSERLAAAVAATGDGRVRVVCKSGGATWIEGLTQFGEFGDDAE
jgi:predicted ATPase